MHRREWHSRRCVPTMQDRSIMHGRSILATFVFHDLFLRLGKKECEKNKVKFTFKN